MQRSPGAPTLILVPTELELARLADEGGFPAGCGLVHLCGFGPIAAAARTGALLERLQPARVVLVGIAGSYDLARLPVGSAAQFRAAAVEGIGVGEGERLLAPPQLGFPQWPAREHASAVHDTLDLTVIERANTSGGTSGVPSGAIGELVLSTCAASDSREHARLRTKRFPTAVAEDMEAFGVALACALASTPLTVVRGISNEVGNRDPKSWRIPAALRAARALTLELLAG